MFRKALTVALLNPRGLLFFPSMMVQPVDARYPHPVVSFLVLGLFFQTLSLIYLNLMAPAASRISRFAARPSCGRRNPVVSNLLICKGLL